MNLAYMLTPRRTEIERGVHVCGDVGVFQIYISLVPARRNCAKRAWQTWGGLRGWVFGPGWRQLGPWTCLPFLPLTLSRGRLDLVRVAAEHGAGHPAVQSELDGPPGEGWGWGWG
eukprot:scaffold47038_cov46-Phaeocystis_antarctica.AAC.3